MLKKDLKKIKLAYIGGGSKQWARVFMNDLALAQDIAGDIVLYDVDVDSAERNKKIGEKINLCKETVSQWNYKVETDLDEALKGADMVFITCGMGGGYFREHLKKCVQMFMLLKNSGFFNLSATPADLVLFSET